MIPADPPPAAEDSVATDAADGSWSPLPRRARTLFLLSALLTALAFTVPAMAAAAWLLPDAALRTAALAAIVVLVPGLFLWSALRRYRWTCWRLDAQGFALRRGRIWSVETRVPGSRVQHLDLLRGPLERHFGLATLVIHTAGTRHSAVSIGGMDAAEAEHLRDVLARRTGGDDDA